MRPDRIEDLLEDRFRSLVPRPGPIPLSDPPIHLARTSFLTSTVPAISSRAK